MYKFIAYLHADKETIGNTTSLPSRHSRQLRQQWVSMMQSGQSKKEPQNIHHQIHANIIMDVLSRADEDVSDAVGENAAQSWTPQARPHCGHATVQ